MPPHDPIAIDRRSPPFDRYTGIRWLAPARSGHESPDVGRHQLYVAQEKKNPAPVLIKVTARPGRVYEQSLANEIGALSTINEKLPDSPYFPYLHEHGRLDDSRIFLVMSLFDELPLATSVGEERDPRRLVAHLLIAIEVARALLQIHALDIFHVDLNPMNILYRASRERPVIRIVDFESSWERARHAAGEFYNPPTTPGFTAPEVAHQPPDARSDLFALGAVLHALLAADLWVPGDELPSRIAADETIDPELRDALLRAVNPDPDKRYPSVTPFLGALEAYLGGIWRGQ